MTSLLTFVLLTRQASSSHNIATSRSDEGQGAYCNSQSMQCNWKQACETVQGWEVGRSERLEQDRWDGNSRSGPQMRQHEFLILCSCGDHACRLNSPRSHSRNLVNKDAEVCLIQVSSDC